MKPKTSETKGTRTALWLGPDEWLILDSAKNPMDDAAKAKVLNSAVDVSHRNTAIIVSGAAAEATLVGRLPAEPVARGVSGWGVFADDFGEGGDCRSAHRAAGVPRGMLAVVQ